MSTYFYFPFHDRFDDSAIGNSKFHEFKKRYLKLEENFHLFTVKPQVQVENHFVGAPVGTGIKLYCRIEASPKPTFQWFNNRRM